MTTEGIDLEAQIEILVNLGERDPLNIMRKLIERYGHQWAEAEVALRAEDFITDLARRRLGSTRRRAELELVSGNELSAAHLRLAKFWIPNQGWKQAVELTASDLRARADWYHVFALAARRREAWCREVADLMDYEGVATLGDLQTPLPVLPSNEEVLELTA